MVHRNAGRGARTSHVRTDASAAAVTFERRASDGWLQVLTLTASLPTVVPAALIVAVTLRSFRDRKVGDADRSPGLLGMAVAPVRPTPVMVRLHRQPADARWWD